MYWLDLFHYFGRFINVFLAVEKEAHHLPTKAPQPAYLFQIVETEVQNLLTQAPQPFCLSQIVGKGIPSEAHSCSAHTSLDLYLPLAHIALRVFFFSRIFLCFASAINLPLMLSILSAKSHIICNSLFAFKGFSFR